MTAFPWTVAPEELFALRGHGGQRFADFVSALIRAEAAKGGVAIDEVKTNTRVNVPDGGIDAEVTVALSGRLVLAGPSAWQFKATQFPSVTESSLTEEANKPEAKRLIQAGHEYLVCVCDDAPANKFDELNAVLLTIVHAINPNAPTPRVLGVGHLADWATAHPPVVLQYFRGHLGHALAYEPWLKKERQPLAKFVELESRNAAMTAIRGHVGAQDGAPVLSVTAPSGAGMSRVVAEAIAPAAVRTIYLPDSTTAIDVATSLINQTSASAVLVVDRCTAAVRNALEDLLRAEAARLRVIVMHDPSEQVSAMTLRLKQLEDVEVQKVIDANFESAPSTHRRAFVRLADGILKIAARLALSYAADRTAFLANEAKWADDELRRLVRDEQDRRALHALSLFKRVGYSGELAAQLPEVCNIFQLDPRDVVRRCRRLASAPGVVNAGIRYLSVRPRLFARPLFVSAWEEYIGEDDLATRMGALSPSLQQALLKQAAEHAPKAIRDALVDWAMPTLRALKPRDLASADVVQQLLSLVHISPSRVGPILASLASGTTESEAQADGERLESWPARMHVVWTLRQLMERRENYAIAEAALFRLARVEGAPKESVRRSGSATEQWATSFRMFLSGTEVSISHRLATLTTKLDQNGPDVVRLAVTALGFTVASDASKTEGAPIVHGELRRPDWEPATYSEYWEGLDAAIALLGRCASDPTHGGAAIDTLTTHGRGLLQTGRVKALRAVFEQVKLDDLQQLAVRGFIEGFLSYDVERKVKVKGGEKNADEEHEKDRYPPEYVAEVREWRDRLVRSDLAGRVLEAASSYRRQFEDKQAWEADVAALGKELNGAPGIMTAMLPVFSGGRYNGAGLFGIGRSVGQADTTGQFLNAVFEDAKAAKNPLFHRGYVVGLADQGERHDPAVKAALDSLEASSPDYAVDLGGMNPRVGDATTRAIRLVREGRLAPQVLGHLPSLRRDGGLLAEAIDVVIAALPDRKEDAAAITLDMLGSLAWDEKASLPADAATLAAIWRVVEIAAGGARGEAHTWGRILRRLSEIDFERAVRLASEVAVKGDYSVREEAACELSVYIPKSPKLVLDTLGPMLLQPGAGWLFATGQRGVVLHSFTFEMLRDWVSERGVDAARIVANYMPSPHVSAEGTPIVPPLTAFVLERFEDDDRVFSAFCTSRHNGQLYSGDIAGQHDREAEVAEKFLSHPLRRVREWAESEANWARRDARRMREHEEELFDE